MWMPYLEDVLEDGAFDAATTREDAMRLSLALSAKRQAEALEKIATALTAKGFTLENAFAAGIRMQRGG
jgi:hypothetical protein